MVNCHSVTIPGISHVFQSAAFRFGHIMISPGLDQRDGQCNFKNTPAGTPAIRLGSVWWDAAEILSNNSIEEFILGLASQLAEDSLLCSDVRNNERLTHFFREAYALTWSETRREAQVGGRDR